MFPLLEDLERHANESPSRIALASPDIRLTFSELKSKVDSATIQLRRAGVTPRAVVAVDLPQAHEWIIDLALMRLATQSVSIAGVFGLGELRADVLITAGQRTSLAKIEITVDEKWFADASNSASGRVPSVAYPRPDSVFRLMLTSGTTGLPRAAAYSVSAFAHRHLDLYWSDGRSELNFMPLSTTGGFHTAAANLRHGQTHRAVDRIDAKTLGFASGEGVRVLCGSPVQVAAAMTVLA
jgi:long-subunit acyl-CoA synthetase (AMP-forming)